MANGPIRAEFWKEFILARSKFPSPKRLKAQFEASTTRDFCTCGCNSFALDVETTVPAVREGGERSHLPFFEAVFRMLDERELIINLHDTPNGHVSYIDVQLGDGGPIPEMIEVVEGEPFFVAGADKVLPDD